MADGSIVITAQLDDSQAQAELTRLNKKIYELQAQIQAATAARAPWAEKADELGVKLDEAKAKLEYMQTSTVHPFSNEEIARQAVEVAKLQTQWNDAMGRVEFYDRKIKTSTQNLEFAEARAGMLAGQLSQVGNAGQQVEAKTGELAGSLEEAGESGQRMGQKIDLGLDKVVYKVEKLGKRISRLVKRVLFFSLITKALRGLRKWFGETIKGSDEASEAIGNFKGALLTLAYPINQVVIPAVTVLIQALTKVISAIAAVVAALTGMTFAEAVEGAKNLQEEKKALDGVGGAAKDAEKSLAGFDEINKLTEKNSGGGGGSSSSAISPLFDALAGFTLPEWLENFLTDFRLTVKDVVFDWSDVSGENIAMKAIAGISALAGGVIGFSIGGIPGALTGSLAGLVFGLIIDTVVFDNNGTISQSELLRMIVVALLAIIGAVAGVAIGGVIGGAIGLSVGLVLGLVISAIDVKHRNDIKIKAGESEFGKLIAAALEGSIVALQVATDLELRVDNITGEVDAGTLANLELAKNLIEKIFNLDAEDNKTATQIEAINALIEELNGLNIDGVKLSFDETTQSVVGTKDAIYETIDALLESYKVEALKEAYKEAYVAQYEAQQNVLEMTGQLEEATRLYEQALEEVREAEERYYQVAAERPQPGYGLNYIWWDQTAGSMQAATEGLEVARQHLADTKEAQDGLVEAVQKSVDTYEKAGQKVDDLGLAYEQMITKTEEAGAAGAEAGKEFIDKTAEAITEEAPVAESAIEAAEAAIKAASDAAADGYVDQGENIVQDIAEGISNKTEAAKTAITGVMNKVSEVVENSINAIGEALSGWFSTTNVGGIVTPVPAFNIPKLASGAVIPPNREFLAVLGDQKRGTNIEAPLETIVDAFRRVIGEGGAGRTVVMEVDGREFGRVVLDAYNTENRRVGMRYGK